MGFRMVHMWTFDQIFFFFLDLEDEEREGSVSHKFQAWVTWISVESVGSETLAR